MVPLDREEHPLAMPRKLSSSLQGEENRSAGPLTGTTLGNAYEVGALLGGGSMGTVYRGRHLRILGVASSERRVRPSPIRT
jgi:hypothetical protein